MGRKSASHAHGGRPSGVRMGVGGGEGREEALTRRMTMKAGKAMKRTR